MRSTTGDGICPWCCVGFGPAVDEKARCEVTSVCIDQVILEKDVVPGRGVVLVEKVSPAGVE